MICDFCGKTLPGTASHYLKLDVKYAGEQNACLLCGHCVHACPARAIKSFDDAVL